MLVILCAKKSFPHRGDDPQKDVGDREKHDPDPDGGHPTKGLDHTGKDEVGKHDAERGDHIKRARQRGAFSPLVKARGDVVGEECRCVHQEDKEGKENDDPPVFHPAREQQQHTEGSTRRKKENDSGDLVFDEARIDLVSKRRAERAHHQNNDGKRGGNGRRYVVIVFVDHRGNQRFQSVIEDRTREEYDEEQKHTA